MMELLKQAMVQGLLRPLDVHFARMIADQHDLSLQLAAAMLSRETAAGHVCLPIARLQPQQLFDGRQPELACQIWQAAGGLCQERWLEVLKCSMAISDGSQPTPLVLRQDCLYLQRLWQSEGVVAQFIAGEQAVKIVDEVHLRAILDNLFVQVTDGPDWQKIAVAVAATSRISIISGGPGTGKTTTVAKLLAALVQLAQGAGLRIQLVAPTGKAAARLTGSLNIVSRQLPITDEERALLPEQAVTLHRLLGAQPGSQRLRYHLGNRLNLDVLVVDEASMVDLTMMERLIEALPMHARVIFLGDRDQLASVEAGAVLGDICRFAELGYSIQRAEQLMRLTGYVVEGRSVDQAIKVRDSLCLLRKSYRFNQRSGIGQLALAVNSGNSETALSILNGSFNNVGSCPLASNKDYQVLLQASVAEYQAYLGSIVEGIDPAEVLALFGRYQLLCAVREGQFGVQGLNEQIERTLYQNGLISCPAKRYTKWYPGRPVMINRNDSVLGLFNGDVGIALIDSNGSLRVWFQRTDGEIKSVQPGRLPAHETAYAITVHKSQGSEFEHTALVLPDYSSPVVTRELLYTAITRARRHLTIYSNEQILVSAICTPTRRRSGLVERLKQLEQLG